MIMKNTFIKVLCLSALFVAMGTIAQAQFRQSIFLNGNLPTGGFAASINESAVVPLGMENMGKAAALGFGGGYRASYRFDVGMGEVAPFLQADFLWNTISSKWSDEYGKMHYDSPNYFSLPVLAGVSYLYDELWNDITLYGEFGLGADFLFISSEGTGDGNLRFAYKPTGSFAWMIGAGAYFGRHVSAGIYYYGMGKHYIDYTKKTLDNNAVAAAQDAAYTLANQRESRTVGSLMLRIGFHF